MCAQLGAEGGATGASSCGGLGWGQGACTRHTVPESRLSPRSSCRGGDLETSSKLAQTERKVRNTRAILTASRVVRRMESGHSAWPRRKRAGTRRRQDFPRRADRTRGRSCIPAKPCSRPKAADEKGGLPETQRADIFSTARPLYQNHHVITHHQTKADAQHAHFVTTW